VAEWLARAELEIVFGESLKQPRYFRCEVLSGLIWSIATIFKKLPNLKLAVPFEEIKWSPPEKDVGITELPVVF
jgi:nitric oxide reductase